MILILKFITSLNTGLFEDEAIYWNWSQTIDASYSLTTVALIKIFTGLFNSSSEIIVRLPALLSNLFIIYFIFKTGHLLNARTEMIFITVITFLSIPFVTIYSAFISPDSFLLTFSVISVYYLMKAVKQNKVRDWILSGVFTGLMILSKYTATLFLIAVAGSLFLIYKNFPKNSLYFFISAIITSSPLIIWNIINEPVWFKYYIFTDADKIDAGFIQTIVSFFLSQISILMPLGFILILVLIIFILKEKPDLPELKLLKYLSLILLAIFIIFSASGKIKGNWFFITYIPLLLYLITLDLKRLSKVLITSITVFNFVLLCVLNLPSDKIEALSHNKVTEIINGSFLYYWPDNRKNINNDISWSDRIIKMKNWKETVSRIESKIESSTAEYDFIASDDFNLCPLLEYYFKGKKDIYLIGDQRFKYINSAESFINLKGKDALIVSYNNSANNLLLNKFEYLSNLEDIKFRMSDRISKNFEIIYGRNFLPEYSSNIK
jgi:hypothetical protein